jgi:hypothetical protein
MVYLIDMLCKMLIDLPATWGDALHKDVLGISSRYAVGKPNQFPAPAKEICPSARLVKTLAG